MPEDSIKQNRRKCAAQKQKPRAITGMPRQQSSFTRDYRQTNGQEIKITNSATRKKMHGKTSKKSKNLDGKKIEKRML